ncbi:MAG: hypothetical protein DRQ64_03010 [Gammaproteobacteria bacterium]|nr:MAG: hypothetical protein DRQ64_03010 [Gammaproteobacteria bacterium]
MILSKISRIEKTENMKRNTGLGIVLVVALFALPSLGRAGADDSPSVNWGRDLYLNYCVSCHGLNGKGDGPAGLALKSPPADLTQLSARNGGEFPTSQVKRYIEGEALIQAHGSRQMPVWGKVFRRESNRTEARMKYLVLAKFLESIQVKK